MTHRKQIQWQTSKGAEVTVTVKLITERQISADGDKATVPDCTLSVVTEVEGRGVVSYQAPNRQAAGLPAGTVAALGVLPVTEANAKRVEDAIAEIKATPEWQAKEAREQAAMKAEAEYYKSTRRIQRAMGM